MPHIHLNVRSEFSLQSGVLSINTLVDAAQQTGVTAMALTDVGRLHGAIDFCKQAQARKIKPIVGLEIPLHDLNRNEAATVGGIVLLAESATGWQNLCLLSSRTAAEKEAAHLNCDALAPYADGLFCLTGGPEGLLAGALQAGGIDKARCELRKLREIFGRDRLFVQMHAPTAPWETLAALGDEEGIRAVAAPTVLYASVNDVDAYAVVRAARSGIDRADVPSCVTGCELRDLRALADEPEIWRRGLDVAEEIADTCNVSPLSRRQAPAVDCPPEHPTPDRYLEHLARTGLKERLGSVSSRYEERLFHEMKEIEAMGVAGYMLLVADYVNAARAAGYPMLNRGACSGCLIAYSLGITEIDPVVYGLHFERFLRRWSEMPDIDEDIESEHRLWPMTHLAETRTNEKPVHLCVFRRYGEKRALMRAAQVLGRTPEDALSVAYRAQANQSQQTPEDELLARSAAMLSGLPERPVIHPCGFALAGGEHQSLPTIPGNDTPFPVLQFDGASTEHLGLVKYDVIGSRTLSLVRNVLELIEERHGVRLDPRAFPIDDPKAYRLLADGLTAGIFQLSSEGVTRALMSLKPDSIEDIAVLLALYRPALSEHLNTFIRRRRGRLDAFIRRRRRREEAPRIHPIIDAVLAPTCGILVFQEQAMQLGVSVGDLSMADADTLRRAMAKRKQETIASYRPGFLAAAVNKGLSDEDATEFFDNMTQDVQWTFNKAHALSYGLAAYHTAYLKANYPLEYLTAYLRVFADDEDTISRVLQDGASMGLRILSPDINAGRQDATIEKGSIRLGLNVAKPFSRSLLSALLEEREQKSFHDMEDICARLAARGLTRSELLALIAAGALDNLPGSRAAKFASAETLLRKALATTHLPAERRQAMPPPQVDALDLLREIASRHRYAARDISMDVYCPSTYARHARFTMWLPVEKVIFDLDVPDIISQAREFAGLLDPDRAPQYAIGLNSKLDQYGDKHLLMLDLDSLDDEAVARLQDNGGYLLKSGRGYHFIGNELLCGLDNWHAAIQALCLSPELRPHLDQRHVDLSLARGYSTLRIFESPAKPERPVMLRTL